MFGWLSLLLLTLLAGCAAEDGAICSVNAAVDPSYSVEIRFRPQEEIQQFVVATGLHPTHEITGATWWDRSPCEIMMITKEAALRTVYGYRNKDGSTTWLTGDLYYEWLLGHENRHCLDGNFHP